MCMKHEDCEFFSENQENKIYSWQESLNTHLDDVSVMPQSEYEEWLLFSILGIKMKEVLEISEQDLLDSIEGTNNLMKLIFERAGDYNDLLPYSADAFLKLTEDEVSWFTKQANLIKEQFLHGRMRYYLPSN